ncbi:MAG: sigma-70 family RNA polymerase sigma factor [Planctomycetota bacterium]
MQTTSVTLIGQFRSSQMDPGQSQEKWSRFLTVYQPFISGWLRRRGIQECDASDIEQDVLTVLLRELPRFRHNGTKGAFRCWLRRVIENQLRRHRRTGRLEIVVDEVAVVADCLANANDPLSIEWEREHDEHLLQSLLRLIRPDFTEATLRSFELLVFDERRPADVADRLGTTKAAVIAAKARVLSRLRSEARRLFEPKY